MTIADYWGLYVGWDPTGTGWHISSFYGSHQIQLGRLLLGCDWFFDETNARSNRATLEHKDGRCDVEASPHTGVVAGKGS